ncbi:unnamed protein product [Gemmata massiliana]|uniref:Uncharacterized protein n=1 Tax=Gemmata massiliana TaxID=1210884 RepID=A0A6P2CVX1_9BACT|nr:hypothetical protein [Gemmata massiliana]VTR93288.1 unnamed protein product [Gemmata massiliana]
MAKRSRIEIGRAILRLAADGELRPLADLSGAAGAPPVVMLRWVIEGRRGVHLDGVKRRGEWWTTPAAVARFLKASAAPADAPA